MGELRPDLLQELLLGLAEEVLQLREDGVDFVVAFGVCITGILVFVPVLLGGLLVHLDEFGSPQFEAGHLFVVADVVEELQCGFLAVVLLGAAGPVERAPLYHLLQVFVYYFRLRL